MTIRTIFAGSAASVMALAVAAPAWAQEAQAEDTGLADIIVTATRRDSDLQTTPIAVSAIDQSIIKQASVGNIGGLAAFVPNFSAETITGFNAASFAMRGVGQNNIIVYFEPPVAVLVDDFVVPSVQTQLLDTFDVQQVEVLRGPQGTLFGKNTTGGAVTVRTKRPKLDGAGLELRARGGSFGTRSFNGALDLPLIEGKLGFRVVAGYEKNDGYYRNGGCYGPVGNLTAFRDPPNNVYIPSKFDGVSGCLDGRRIGGKEVANARAKLLFEPNSTISALFQYEILRDRSGTVPSVNENYLYTGPTPFLTTLLNTGAFQPNNRDPLDNAAITLRNDAFLRDEQRINVDGLYANIDFKFDIGSLTSVTGLRKQKSRLPNSYAGNAPRAADGQPLSIFDASRDDNRKTFQQELRFATNTGGSFDVVAGVFFQKDKTDFCVSQILGFLDLTNGPLPFGNWNDTPYILCNAQKARSKAAYAEGTYKITPELTLTGGLRYTKENKTWRGRQQAFIPTLNGGFDPTITLTQPLDASVYKYTAGVITVKDKASEVTWRASLGYQASPEIYVYGTASHGFKAGGFNDQIGGFAPFTNLAGVQDLVAFAQAAQATKPETADSFEIGIKTNLLDDRVRFNLTGFHVKYNDLQRQLNVPLIVNGAPNQVTIFVNAASAKVDGIEAELTAKATDNLILRGVLGYQNARYGSYTAPGAGYDLGTSPLDRAPKWQWTIDGTYDVPLGSHKLVLNGNVAYQARNLFTQSNSDPLGNSYLDARTLLNASITFAKEDDSYYLRLVGQNLSDQRYRTASQNVAGLWLNSQFGPPRYYGVEGSVKF